MVEGRETYNLIISLLSTYYSLPIKNIMRNLFFVFLLGMGLIGMSGCGCDDPTDPSCDNYDPCFFEKQQPPLDFDVYEVIGVANAPTFLTDTIIPGSMVSLEANRENAISYEWWYGLDTVKETDGNISFRFGLEDSTLLLNNPVPVTLIIEYEPNSECYLSRTGRDTVTKYIYFKMMRDVAYKGKWQVYRNGDTENPYEIEIRMIEGEHPISFELQIANLYNEGIECLQTHAFNYFSHSEFKASEFNFNEFGCGAKGYKHSTSLMTGKVDTDKDRIYLTWREGYYNNSNTEFLYRPHTIVGHKID